MLKILSCKKCDWSGSYGDLKVVPIWFGHCRVMECPICKSDLMKGETEK